MLLVVSSVGCAAIKNLQTVHQGLLYRSGRPDKTGYQQMKRMGIKTVVNLEESEQAKEESWARANNINYHRIPIGGLDCPTLRDIDEALEIITEESNQPVLVHCHLGKDRTGIVTAAYRIRYDGWTPEKAIQELRSKGHAGFLYHCDSVLYDVK